MLTIGEFSKICFVTKKTLRHYDEIGLLRPEHVADNGYRYYEVSQLRTMLLISKLKTYGLSLPEIAAYLADPDDERLAELLLGNKRKMQSEIESNNRILRKMEQDIDKLKRRMDIMHYDIQVKVVELDPMTLFGLRKTIDVKEFQEVFGDLFKALMQNKIQPLGAPMAFYYDEGFDREHCDIEVAVPVASSIEGTHELAGGLHCVSTILGPYSDEAFSSTYAEMAKWVEENGYRIRCAPFDKYVKGGPDISPEEYVTEVYFPIEKQ